MRRLAVAILALGCLAGCQAPKIEDAALTATANPERRHLDLSEPARPLIILTLSGGGTRAAVLASAVVRELSQHSYQTSTGQHALSDDIQIVSSVSGGSVTGAWLALHGARDLDTLDQAFLTQDEMAPLIDAALSPVTWYRLAFTDFARIDALESLLNRQLFHDATMEAINQPHHPYVVLNATDMSSGEVFGFTPQRFDDLCADFDATPVAVGVAASAAFPVALSPVTLKVFSAPAGTPGCHLKAPEWIERELSDRKRRYTNITRYKDGLYAARLRHLDTGLAAIDYLHLLDGGVADNLGITSVYNAMTRPDSPVPVLDAINQGCVQKLVLITVNARTDPPRAIDTSPSGAGLIAAIDSVTTVPLDSTTAGMERQVTTLMDDFKDAAQAAKQAAAATKALFTDLKTYNVTIDFDQFLPEQSALRDRDKAVPTSWSLTAAQVADIRTSGTLLLNQHPDFQTLLQDLAAPQPAALLGQNEAASCPNRAPG